MNELCVCTYGFPGSILTLDGLRAFRQLNRGIVLTNGIFDLFHPGHARSLEFARTQGRHLIVAINSDDSVKVVRGGLPLYPEITRAEMILANRNVCHVVLQQDTTALKILSELRPDTYVKGDDYRGKKFAEQNFCGLENIEMKFAPRDHWSSTFLKAKLRAGYG